jgi:sphingosine kinase
MEGVGLLVMAEALYSGQVGLGRHTFTLMIKRDSLTYVRSRSSPPQEFSYEWQDVIGAVSSSGGSFKVIAYPRRRQKRELRVRTRQELEFTSTQSSYWVACIQSFLILGRLPEFGEEVPRKKFFVVVNPVSGRGIAVRNWGRVEGMFAACKVTVVETTHPGHAGEIALELEPGSVLILVSGDGLVHEVVNALCKADRRSQVIAPIPGGSANAFAYELCKESGEEYSLETCAFIAQKGSVTALDVTKLELLTEQRTVYSFLMFAWAIIADIDIESEV